MDISKTSFGSPGPDEPLTLGWLKRQIDEALERGASADLPVLLRVTDAEGDTAGDGGLTAVRVYRGDREYAKSFLMDAHVDVRVQSNINYDRIEADYDSLENEMVDDAIEREPEEPGLIDVLDDPMSGYDSNDDEDQEDDEEE